MTSIRRALFVPLAGGLAVALVVATVATYLRARDEGFPTERLVPLLAGLEELLPWIRQWHPEVDPGMGLAMGEFFSSFVSEQMRELGLS